MCRGVRRPGQRATRDRFHQHQVRRLRVVPAGNQPADHAHGPVRAEDEVSPAAAGMYHARIVSRRLERSRRVVPTATTRPPDSRTWLTIAAVAADTTYLSGCGPSPLSCDDTPVCSVTGAISTPPATSVVTSRWTNGRAALGISALPETSPKTVWYAESGKRPRR